MPNRGHLHFRVFVIYPGRKRNRGKRTIPQHHHDANHFRDIHRCSEIQGWTVGRCLLTGKHWKQAFSSFASPRYAMPCTWFFLYTFNADLLTEFKNVTINTLKITGQNSPLFKMLEENVDVYFVPASIAFGELFNRIIVGAAFSLFIAGLVRRSKLPFNPQEF